MPKIEEKKTFSNHIIYKALGTGTSTYVPIDLSRAQGRIHTYFAEEVEALS